MIVEEASEANIGREAKVENAGKVFDVGRNMVALEQIVQALHHVGSSFAEPLLQRRSFRFEVLHHSFYGGHRKRVPDESSGKEGHTHRGIGIIAVLPHAAVERIHIFRFTGQHADGHSARENLSIGCEIGANTEKRLATTRMDAEAGDDLIENQARVRFLRDLANLFQKLNGLQIRVAALHRLNHNRCEILCVLTNPAILLCRTRGRRHWPPSRAECPEQPGRLAARRPS